MLYISCPWCGSREEGEFSIGRPLEKTRPAAPAELGDADWAAYLFDRRNPRGPSLERWRHSFGCRQWFAVERDTVSHVVLRVATFDALGARSGDDAGEGGSA